MEPPPCQPIRLDETGEGRGAFGGFIGPRTLLAQVWNTAPWLLHKQEPDATGAPLDQRAMSELGWRDILVHALQLEGTESPDETGWLQYFALCLAAHFGTCATHVPTDVDSKIRGHLWFRIKDPALLERAVDLAEQLVRWDIRGVSARTQTFEGYGTISGHDGERLSVLAAGVLRCLKAGYDDGAERLTAAIDLELKREVAVFRELWKRPGQEKALALVCGNLTHNAGDLDQGLSCDEGKRVGADHKARWSRLAHEQFERFDGVFFRASAINKAVMSPEAHRHYPLRKILKLRTGRRWLRPAGPFLDAWGGAMARNERWSYADRATVLDGLLFADKRVPGQEGYARALVGFADGLPGGLDSKRLNRHLGTAQRRHLKDPELRRKLSVSRASFEARMAKRARTEGARRPPRECMIGSVHDRSGCLRRAVLRRESQCVL